MRSNARASEPSDEVTVELPWRLEGGTLAPVISEFVAKCGGHLPKRAVFDFGRLSNFIRPEGVTFLHNFIRWLQHKGVKVQFKNHTADTAPLIYLDNSQFFAAWLGKPLRGTASVRSTTLPLVDLQFKDSHHWLRGSLVPWLADRLGKPKASLSGFQQCVAELFNNINDHSGQTVSSTFVQHFPNENRVWLSIADFGLGIPESVKARLAKHPHLNSVAPGQSLNDNQAIRQAVKEGFTAKSTPGNQGQGLDILLSTIVGNNGGEVAIQSLKGHILFQKSGHSIKPAFVGTTGFCPGTTITIRMRTDVIEAVEDNETEDFEW